jgi:isopenicillin-N N-acyltransferase like protein
MKLMTCSPLKPSPAPLALSGTPYEIGRRHGEALGRVINEFLSDRYARINVLRTTPIYKGQLARRLARFCRAIETYVPMLAEELHGLSAGAGISVESAVLLQVRRELIGYSPFTMGECSLSAHLHSPFGPYVAQTVDLNGQVGDLGTLMTIAPTDHRTHGIAMYTLAGLLGFAGMNDAGVCIGINLVLGGGWRVGVPPYLLVRHLLTHCGSVDECLEELKRLPTSSSRAFTMCDGQQLATVEMVPHKQAVLRGDVLFHTNHFLAKDMKAEERINPFAWRASADRLKLISETTSVRKPASPDEVISLLRDHSLYPVGLCAHADGDVRKDESVAALIMCADDGIMLAAVGQPCQTEAIEVSVPDTAKARTSILREKVEG